jgi:hypothetical protein
MTTKEHLDKHDRQIAAIRALLQEGMRLVIETRKDFRVIAALQKQTDELQKRTEQKLEALIDSMRRGGNGHAKRRLDLE